MYVDETIIKDAKYRYYVRFADSKGNRNRTEWSEEISNPNSTYTDAIKFKYSFDGTACYLYDKTSKQLTFMVGDTETDFTSPYVTKPEITDFDTLYKTAIVFKTGDIIKVFDIEYFKST